MSSDQLHGTRIPSSMLYQDDVFSTLAPVVSPTARLSYYHVDSRWFFAYRCYWCSRLRMFKDSYSHLYYSSVLMIVTTTFRHQISTVELSVASGIGCVVESCRKSSSFSCYFDTSPELQIIVGDLGLPTATTSCNGSFRQKFLPQCLKYSYLQYSYYYGSYFEPKFADCSIRKKETCLIQHYFYLHLLLTDGRRQLTTTQVLLATSNFVRALHYEGEFKCFCLNYYSVGSTLQKRFSQHYYFLREVSRQNQASQTLVQIPTTECQIPTIE